MTNEPEIEKPEDPQGDPRTDKIGAGKTGKVFPLPGMIGIGLYMLVLAAVVSFGAVGGHLPKLFLILVPFFVTASFGMLRMFRWAWALTLSAVFLLMTYDIWLFLRQKEPGGAV